MTIEKNLKALRETLKPGNPGYPKEWTHNADGEPVCTAFEVTDGD